MADCRRTSADPGGRRFPLFFFPKGGGGYIERKKKQIWGRKHESYRSEIRRKLGGQCGKSV